MLARLTAFPPELPAIPRSLRRDDALRVGRGDDNGLRLSHPSVSRHHAVLEPHGDGWRLRDLGSKNGSYVGGQRIDVTALDGSCWLRFGEASVKPAP